MLQHNAKQRVVGVFTAGDDNLDVGMVDNVLDSVSTQGIIQRNRDQVVGVATHLSNEPLGATVRPDTKRPAIELLIAQDDLVQVHNTASKGIDALVDLAVGLPGVAAVGLGNSVVRTVAQEVVVGILCHRWSITEREKND